jgi:VanZ family protein
VKKVVRRVFLSGTLLYWIALLVATHMPPKHMPHIQVWDKLEHFGAYFLLAAAIDLTFINENSSWRAILIVWLTCVAYGAFDELTQPMFGRDCEFNDWFADSLGSGISVLLLTLARHLFNRRPIEPIPQG